jgi:DDE family transposase
VKVQRDGRHFTVDVVADGEGLVSHAGAALLADCADRLGLTEALSRALAPMRERRGRHDPGRVVRDLAVMLADGGDCLADLRAVRDQQSLFGPVASDATAFRVIDRIASDPGLLDAVRAARARAREHAWSAGAAPERVIVDIDATLISAHSEKDGAAGTFKRGFGFYPLLAFLDESREALAGVLRPGNAGANTAADHIEIIELALEQLPRDVVETTPIVVRTDSAAATHQFTDELRAARIGFLMGLDLTAGVREAILGLPDAAWQPAIRQDGETREGARVAELTDRLDLSARPHRSRVIVRRERPHPGAQLSFSDHHGHRFLATLTDLDGDAVGLECLHRARANAEDRMRAAKQTGLDNLPFRDVDHNAVWLELSLIAQHPDRPDPAARARRRARPLRTQDAALPAAAHRRPTRLSRPPRHLAPATHLALDRRPDRRLRPPGLAATTRALTPPAPHDHDQSHRGASRATRPAHRQPRPPAKRFRGSAAAPSTPRQQHRLTQKTPDHRSRRTHRALHERSGLGTTVETRPERARSAPPRKRLLSWDSETLPRLGGGSWSESHRCPEVATGTRTARRALDDSRGLR